MDTIIWTEKYRPQKFSQVIGQDAIVKRVTAFVKMHNMPHLMFAGPAGVGKSTLAIVIAKELFGENWKQNFVEFNASDERGIDVVRVKVKDFARTKALGDVPFKIIFLDECDALTKEAQQALRRTMENYTKTCRFILSCNFSSKILDPIQSRCVVFKFKPLEKKHIDSIIDNIAKEEEFSIDQEAKDALFDVSGGDVRKLENIMQSCASVTDTITADTIYAIASYANPKEVRTLLAQTDFKSARNLALTLMLDHGMSGLDLIKQIQQQIWDLDIENIKKLKMVKMCGDIEFRLVEGSDEFIQIEALLAALILVKNATTSTTARS